MRVVSLLPSATEIVRALGHEDRLVGVSHSCALEDLPRVTSTRVPFRESSETIDSYVRDHLGEHDALYDLDVELLTSLAPDVVVSQALCDVCAVSTGDVQQAINSLPSSPVLVDLEPNTLDDVIDDVLRVGTALGDRAEAFRLQAELKQRRRAVAAKSAGIPEKQRPRVAFLEWLSPPFNGGHWNPELVEIAGGIDLLGAPGRPSSTLDWATISAASPDVIFVACCGLTKERALEDIETISQSHEWQELPAVKNRRVYVADGDFFSCPGPGLIDGLELLAHVLHPGIHPAPAATKAVNLT
ncbi:MAG: cobalamin-binding protein [Woeseiaceae bacterium]